MHKNKNCKSDGKSITVHNAISLQKLHCELQIAIKVTQDRIDSSNLHQMTWVKAFGD